MIEVLIYLSVLCVSVFLFFIALAIYFYKDL